MLRIAPLTWRESIASRGRREPLPTIRANVGGRAPTCGPSTSTCSVAAAPAITPTAEVAAGHPLDPVASQSFLNVTSRMALCHPTRRNPSGQTGKNSIPGPKHRSAWSAPRATAMVQR